MTDLTHNLDHRVEVPFWCAPKVVREARSTHILKAWYEQENKFSREQLASSFFWISGILLLFIPLDLSIGVENPDLSYVLILRGIPSLLFALAGLTLRFAKKPWGDLGFLYPRSFGIALVGILVALQYSYVTDFADRARFYPPVIAALAILVLRVDWFEALVIYAMQVWIWLMFSDGSSATLLSDVNYQIFGALIAGLFHRRLAYEAAHFVSEEQRKKMEKENDWLRLKRSSMALQRFLPSQVAEDIARGKIDFSAKPRKAQATMLFCDIVEFRKLADEVQLETLSEFLNRFYESMTDIVFQHGGMIDRFIGDGVLAVFGFPETMSPQEQAERAAACGRAMLKKFPKIQQELADSRAGQLVKIRIGIHQGEVIIGGFGGEHRTDYMTLGTTSLMAQRLKSTAPEQSIMISEAVAEALSFAGCEDYGERILRGIGPRRVFCLHETGPEDGGIKNVIPLRQKMAA